MKTVCKKLLCLMLVAMMLVSAVPFAFAAEDTVKCTIHNVDATRYTAYDVAATCAAVGKDGYLCPGAGSEHMVYKEVAKVAHKYDDGAVTTPATCKEAGVKTFTCTVCSAGTEGHTKTEPIPTTSNHSWNTGLTTTDPTCGAAGVKTFTCTVCGTTKTESVAATGNHAWGAPVQTKAPTCTEKGENTFTCTVCGATKREDIAANGHDRNGNGVCSVCGDVEAENYTLYFHYLNAEGKWSISTQVVQNGDDVNLPQIPLVNGKDFLHWEDEDDNQITEDTIWNIGESQTITAIYENDTTEDGLVDLTVYVSYYVDGEWHHEAKLFTERFEKTNKNTMFEWLYSDAGKKQTREALEAKGYYGYDWAQVKYYDYYDDGEVTEADLKSDGNKTVYIKVNSTKEIEATVLLYVHKKVTATVDRVIPMPGYTAGDYVRYDKVKEAVKTKYSGSNMTISDLYTESDWEDLLDDIESSGSRSIKVEDNGTTEIHVIVKNATSKTSNADSSNPKTGDYITIAATTMVLAAAALVSVIELKKRKMI